jgi:GNAT superfamily N-acetyltransferase
MSGEATIPHASDEAAGAPAFVLRDPETGDMGRVVTGHAELYTTEYGWDRTFEALVADIVATFVRTFVPGRERCWIATLDGRVVGSVFLVRESDDTAKLRLLYVDPAARGMGLGARLVSECIAFARACGYRRMVLWTNDVLVSARRIYEAEGFELIESAPHRSFGKDLVGQTWGREL